MEELERRFRKDRARFDSLATRAIDRDAYLGCSCPTKRNPDVYHGHTVLALDFMHAQYPDLEVRMPAPTI